MINAGGIINVALEIYPEPYCEKQATELVNNIYNTLEKIFVNAKEQNLPTGIVSDEMAKEIIAKGQQL